MLLNKHILKHFSSIVSFQRQAPCCPLSRWRLLLVRGCDRPLRSFLFHVLKKGELWSLPQWSDFLPFSLFVLSCRFPPLVCSTPGKIHTTCKLSRQGNSLKEVIIRRLKLAVERTAPSLENTDWNWKQRGQPWMLVGNRKMIEAAFFFFSLLASLFFGLYPF